MSENRPVNKYRKQLAEYRERANPTLEGTTILAAMGTAFGEGVDATLEMLRPWLVQIEREYEDDMGKMWCTGCGVSLNLHPHADWCPWPKIDAILGGRSHDS